MVVAEKESDWPQYKIRIPDAVWDAWKELCVQKNISQQDAGRAAIEFVLMLNDTIQSMIFRQVYPSEDLIKLALREWKRFLDEPKAQNRQHGNTVVAMQEKLTAEILDRQRREDEQKKKKRA